jgi:ATP-binding cassette subfamily F protein uup
MDRLVDHLFVFEGDGIVRDFPGNYTQYRIWLKDFEKEKQSAEKAGKKSDRSEEYMVGEHASTDQHVKKDMPQQSAVLEKKKKLSYKEQREFEQLEKEIPALEQEKADISEKMAAPNLPYDELQKLSARITEVTQQLEEKELRWLELSELQ